ncbi:MAG: hypothetical protein ACE5E5_14885, partial [Phycisphaerae bacterium]
TGGRVLRRWRSRPAIRTSEATPGGNGDNMMALNARQGHSFPFAGVEDQRAILAQRRTDEKSQPDKGGGKNGDGTGTVGVKKEQPAPPP